VGQVLLAGEEPDERPPPVHGVVADRAAQHRVAGLESVEDQADSRSDQLLWVARSVASVTGLRRRFVLSGAKADERQTLLGILDADPELPAWRVGQLVIGGRNYFGREFEAELAEAGLDLLHPARKSEAQRTGTKFFKPLWQVSDLHSNKGS